MGRKTAQCPDFTSALVERNDDRGRIDVSLASAPNSRFVMRRPTLAIARFPVAEDVGRGAFLAQRVELGAA